MYPILLSTVLFAKTFQGISLPDQIVLQETTLYLNGMGLREKYWIDIYVAGLYLQQPTSNATQIIKSDIPKRLQLQFIYPNVPKERMLETLKENLERNPDISRDTIQKIDSAAVWMEDFTTGDEIIFDYIPETGTIFTINGEQKGVVPGKDFMEAIFGIYVGSHPASEQLKQGLLGY